MVRRDVIKTYICRHKEVLKYVYVYYSSIILITIKRKEFIDIHLIIQIKIWFSSENVVVQNFKDHQRI